MSMVETIDQLNAVFGGQAGRRERVVVMQVAVLLQVFVYLGCETDPCISAMGGVLRWGEPAFGGARMARGRLLV